MRKLLAPVAALLIAAMALTACQTTSGQNNSNTTAAAASTEESEMAASEEETGNPGDILTPTDERRVIENGTAITLTIGDTVIPATLNDSAAAQDLISRLPYTIPLYKYPDDYCAVMEEPLAYDEADQHRGWMTGDIDFVMPAEWFVLLFNQNGLETTSTWHINLGSIDGDLSVFNDLPNSVEVLIELAE